MVTINRYIKAMLHPTGGHQGSHKAHQAGNQSKQQLDLRNKFNSNLNPIQPILLIKMNFKMFSVKY